MRGSGAAAPRYTCRGCASLRCRQMCNTKMSALTDGAAVTASEQEALVSTRGTREARGGAGAFCQEARWRWAPLRLGAVEAELGMVLRVEALCPAHPWPSGCSLLRLVHPALVSVRIPWRGGAQAVEGDPLCGTAVLGTAGVVGCFLLNLAFSLSVVPGFIRKLEQEP